MFFDKLDVIKRGVESMWNIQNDRIMMALAMTMTDKPMAVNMAFSGSMPSATTG